MNWRRFQGNTWRLPNFKKRLNLYSFYGNVVNKSVVTRMSLRSDKDLETYLLKSGQMTMKKWAAIDSSLEALTFIKKIIYTTFPFF
jgi:hypothetical protein